jgi:chromosome segregation ATPase
MINRMPELEQNISKAIRERDSLKEAMVSLTSETQKLKAENKRLLEGLHETEAIVTECDHVKYKITMLEEVSSNAIQENESLNKVKKDLESQIEKLKDYRKELLKRNMEAKALRTLYDNMKDRMPELKQKFSNAVQKIDCLLEATASLMSEMEALTAENKRLLEGLDKTEAIVTECDYMK